MTKLPGKLRDEQKHFPPRDLDARVALPDFVEFCQKLVDGRVPGLALGHFQTPGQRVDGRLQDVAAAGR